MSDAIRAVFERRGKVFIPFVVAGDPSLAKTEEFIVAMAQAGAGIIEIGIPFSDPIAQGAVIQEANVRALSAPTGVSTDMVFDMVARVSNCVDVPMVFLTYLNLIYKYGYEKFCARCEQVGIKGLIIPDLSHEERSDLAPIAAAYGVDVIALIAPSSGERVRMIASAGEGYLCLASSMGVTDTGAGTEIATDVTENMEKIREVTDVPVAIELDISTPEQARQVAGAADGVIVSSAIVKIIAQYGERSTKHIREYVAAMVKAMEVAG